jgi:D-alanyl-lipoteichoic acid acyltransferase DltB (MBOAT superfamily)
MLNLVLIFISLILLTIFIILDNFKFKSIVLLLNIYFCFFISFKLLLALTLTVLISYWLFILFRGKYNRLLFLLCMSLVILLPWLLVSFFLKNYLQNDLNLPATIGMSFYSFKMAGTALDRFFGNEEDVPNFMDYCLFLSFFPTLACGPIFSFENFSKQINIAYQKKSLNVENVTELIEGLFYKFFIANNLKNLIILNYSQSKPISKLDIILYFFSNLVLVTVDFTSYSLIAKSLASMLGVSVTRNFSNSLLSFSMVEFWSKHHISLSQWFKSYIYFPMIVLSSKILSLRVSSFVSLGIVFIVSGLWHRFDKVGLLFALVQVVGFILSGLLKYYNKKFTNLFWTLSVNALSFTLLLEFENLSGLIGRMSNDFYPTHFSIIFISMFFVLIEFLNVKFKTRFLNSHPAFAGVFYSLLFSIIIISISKSFIFLYFNF